MTESRWANVYPDGHGGRFVGARMYPSRAAADLGGMGGRLYVIRFDLDDEGDRDEVTREAV